MAEKTWIKLKRGILEKKHRDELGIRIWLYLYMLDIVDWDTGIITLNTGGWETSTTKLRMNQASSEWGLGYHVYQHKHDWFVTHDGNTYNYTDKSQDSRGEVVTLPVLSDNSDLFER